MDMSWGAVDSYGQPAAADTFPDYDPRNPHPTFNHASSKNSITPSRVVVKSSHHHKLTPDKLNKINQNLEKLNEYLANNIQVRSSEEQSKFVGMEAFSQMLKKGPLLPTPVITDNEIGVLPAELLPETPSSTTTTTTSTTTTTQKPTTESDKENKRERKDVKYILRGNRIVVHG